MPPLPLRRCFLSLFALALAAHCQTPARDAGPATPVTCGARPPLASHTVRSEILVSPDGKHRAYAEVEATALYPQRPSGYSGPLCVNHSRLFVSADTPDFRLVFLQEPTDMENGNSLRLIDWSSDSRRLLVELTDWLYDQPGSTRNVLIYDTRFTTFQQPDLAHALAKAYARDCSLNFRVAGFNLSGKIALEADPLSPEEEEVQALPSCARKKTWFEMDRPTETLVSVPEPPKLQHNAKAEPAPAK